ncbi:MAG TPA: type II toxin-antitoxin system HicA family toxin [Candidatus Paceibacterota bacterium]
MNRAAFIKHLEKNSCFLLREGAKHSIYRNLRTGQQTTVPRHAKLLTTTARSICKQLGVPWAT